MPLLVLIAVMLAGCSGYPRECTTHVCRQDFADGGCVAGAPVCCGRGGGPSCPPAYRLTEDAGSCGPMPAEDRRFCL
jgi:hypothetical protein